MAKTATSALSTPTTTSTTSTHSTGSAAPLVSGALSLNRSILNLALPAVAENLLGTAVFLADAVLLGRLGDPAALAAAGISRTYLYIANSLFMALGIGAVALVARAYGEGDIKIAKRLGAQSITVSIVIAVLISLLLIPFTQLFMREVMKISDPEVVRQATVYANLILSTSVLALPAMTIASVMRATGDSRTPMLITLFTNALNIALAALLIFGAGPVPAFKIEGAGAATSVARAAGGLLSFWALARGSSGLQVRLRELAIWEWGNVVRVWRLAWPNIMEQAIQRVGFITFTGILVGLGTAALAAHQIADSVESLAFMPAWGFSIATASLVGQALGAGDPELAARVVRRAFLLSTAVMSLFALLFVSGGPTIVGWFGARGDVADLAGVAVRIAALELLPLSLYQTYGNAIRGAGDTRSPMIVSIIGVIAFRISAVYVLVNVLHLGLAGIWLGTAIDWTGRALVMYALYRTGRWKRMRV